MIILRLDRVMADRKISLKDLAEQIGIANVNLSKIKTGKISAIRFSTLEAICDILNCQPGDILEYNSEAIHDLIISRRKQDLLISLEEELFEEALANKTFRLYNRNE